LPPGGFEIGRGVGGVEGRRGQRIAKPLRNVCKAVDGEHQGAGAIERIAHHHDGLAEQHGFGTRLAVDRDDRVGAAQHGVIVGLRRQQDEIIEAAGKFEQAAGGNRADLGRMLLDHKDVGIGDGAQQEVDGRDLVEIFRRAKR
jgi:hypothetical protein